MDRPYIAVGTMVMRNGKILMGERLKNHGAMTFQITGGYLEFGEKLVDCARREAEEETGLTDLKNFKLVSLNNDIVYGKHYISLGFTAESQTGEPTDPEPEKSRNWKWYDPKHLPSPIFEPSKRVIDAWLSGVFCEELKI